jgi:DNA-binding transcriptional LysR family regulator
VNLRQLRTLVAFLDQRGFSAAGEQIGLSHSAVSVQMRQLEAELAATLFDHSSRPRRLTETGEAVALLARELLQQEKQIRSVAAHDQAPKSVTIGCICTTLPYALPTLLQGIRAEFPDTDVTVKTSLSEDLAQGVARGDLDFALVTMPRMPTLEIEIVEIAQEPLYVIGPVTRSKLTNDSDLLRSKPFISYSRDAWLGQQIALELQARNINPFRGLQVDSIDAAERLVLSGFGVSIVPLRFLSAGLPKSLAALPFGDPVEVRKLALINRVHGGMLAIRETILNTLAQAAA